MIQQSLRIEVIARYSGTVEIPIPEHVAISDTKTLKEYVASIWEDVQLPEMTYIPGTEKPDWENPWYINGYIETSDSKAKEIFEELKRRISAVEYQPEDWHDLD